MFSARRKHIWLYVRKLRCGTLPEGVAFDNELGILVCLDGVRLALTKSLRIFSSIAIGLHV
jgi:hypothetical protein